MQLYQCKVRLNSNIMNEVPKIHVTVPEIIVLRIVHSMGEGQGGHAPVDDIKPMFDAKNALVTVERTDAEERERLESLYAGALQRNKQYPTVNAIFGVGVALPKTTEGIQDAPVEGVKRRSAAGADPLS